MADFTAKIQGILDLTKVESSISKLENKKINLKGVTISKFTLDTSSLPNTIQASLDKHKFTISLDGIKNTNIESTNKSLKSTTSELQNLVSLSKQIGNLEIKIKGLDSTSGHSNQISALKTQLSELKTTYNETLAALEANGFNFDSSKVSTSINQVQDKLTELDAKIQDTKTNLAEGIAVDFDNGKFDISGIVEKFDNLDDKTEEVTTKVETLKTAYNDLGDALQSGDIDAIINSYEKYQTAAESAKTEVNNLATAQKTLSSSNTLSNQIQTWMNNNKKAAQEYGDELTELQNKLKDNTSASTLTTVKDKFNEIKSAAQSAGLTTDSFASSISKAALQMVGLGSAVQVLQKAVSLCQEAVNAVVELDDALVDLQKTTTASYSELQDFYYEANEVAKEYGATTQEIIQSAADWSRLGYSLDDSELMAQYSSMFSSISPGMDVDTATTGLVSVMKAYGIEAEEVLDGVMSKINAVGNSAATSNDEIITGLQNSAAALAVTGSTLDENIALFTAAQEITQDASKVGNALRSISMRIRGYDEETEELSDDLVNISGEVIDLTKTASNNFEGISLFTDESQTEYKSIYTYLQEVSEIYDELSAKDQQNLLEKLFGKNRASVGAAILSNFSAAEKAMDTMENSAGSAEAEMETITESLTYKLNALQQTAVGIAQNLFPQDLIGGAIEVLTSLLEVVDGLTEHIGLLGTVLVGAGIATGIKSLV